MRGEVLKGHLDLLLLATVAVRPVHGYALVEALRERSGGVFTLAEGTVYPALYRLERGGFLRSKWTTQDGRRRRVYALTRKGRKALAEGHKEWQWFVRAVESVVRRDESSAIRASPTRSIASTGWPRRPRSSTSRT